MGYQCSSLVQEKGCCGITFVLAVTLASFDVTAFIQVLSALFASPITILAAASQEQHRRRLLGAGTSITVAIVNKTSAELLSSVDSHRTALQASLGYNITSVFPFISGLAATNQGGGGGNSASNGVAIDVGIAVGLFALSLLIALLVMKRRRSSGNTSDTGMHASNRNVFFMEKSTISANTPSVDSAPAQCLVPAGVRSDRLPSASPLAKPLTINADHHPPCDFLEPTSMATHAAIYPGLCSAHALYSFDGTPYEGAVSLQAGDKIELLSSNEDEPWWEGVVRGQRGVFPASYVLVEKLPPQRHGLESLESCQRASNLVRGFLRGLLRFSFCLLLLLF